MRRADWECVPTTSKQWDSFTKNMKAKPGETVIFSYIVFKSRAHRDRVNAKVMKQMQKMDCMPTQMPFDATRMAYGGFKAVVET